MSLDHRLIEGLMEGIAPIIKDAIAVGVKGATEALRKDISDLNLRLTGMEEFRDVMPNFDISAIESMVATEVAKLPLPEKGKDADPALVAELVAGEVHKAITALPQPKDGESVTIDDVRPIVLEAVAALPPAEPGAPGKSVDPNDVAAMVDQAVAKSMAAIPIPKDGKSVTLDDVRPIVDDAVSKLPVAKDGIGIVDAIIDRDGVLVLTLTDGSAKKVGGVVGKDADRDEMFRIITEQVDNFPRPRDGIDGLGFNDLEVLHDGERKFTLRFSRDDQIKEFSFDVPMPIDRGVWREGGYKKGDGVSFGGSFFIAQEDTTDKPESSKAWRLAVKRGRDGRDGKNGERGERGEKGEKGDRGERAYSG